MTVGFPSTLAGGVTPALWTRLFFSSPDSSGLVTTDADEEAAPERVEAELQEICALLFRSVELRIEAVAVAVPPATVALASARRVSTADGDGRSFDRGEVSKSKMSPSSAD